MRIRWDLLTYREVIRALESAQDDDGIVNDLEISYCRIIEPVGRIPFFNYVRTGDYIKTLESVLGYKLGKNVFLMFNIIDELPEEAQRALPT